MEHADELKAMGLIRKAIAPLLREELTKAIGQEVSQINAAALDKVLTVALDKVLSKAEVKLKVEIDTKALDAHIQEFLQKRDTHIRYEPNISVDVPGMEKIANSLRKSADSAAVSDYRPHDQDNGDIFSYFGFMHPSGSWYIMRSSSNDQRYTSGSGEYSEAWESRANQQYGLIDQAFNG